MQELANVRHEGLLTFRENIGPSQSVRFNLIDKKMIIVTPEFFQKTSRHNNFIRGLVINQTEKNHWQIDIAFIWASEHGFVEEIMLRGMQERKSYGMAEYNNEDKPILKHSVIALNYSQMVRYLDLQFDANGTGYQIGLKGQDFLNELQEQRYGRQPVLSYCQIGRI